MTGSAIAAMVVGDAILGGAPNPWADTYSPSRLSSALKVSSLEVRPRLNPEP